LAVENFGAKLERQVFGRGCCCTHQRPRIHATRRQIGESLGERGQIQQKPFFAKGLGKNVRFRVRLVWVVVFSSGPSCVVRENTIGNHQLKNLCFSLLPPVFLKTIINYFTPNQTSTTEQQALLSGLIIVLSIFLRALIFHIMVLELSSFGVKIRIACCSLVYRKLLKLKCATIQKVSLGRIVNMLSNDAERFDNGFTFLHQIWSGPIKMVAAIGFLIFSYGYNSTVGLTAPVVYLLVQS
jgi:hypothetical protein